MFKRARSSELHKENLNGEEQERIQGRGDGAVNDEESPATCMQKTLCPTRHHLPSSQGKLAFLIKTYSSTAPPPTVVGAFRIIIPPTFLLTFVFFVSWCIFLIIFHHHFASLFEEYRSLYSSFFLSSGTRNLISKGNEELFETN